MAARCFSFTLVGLVAAAALLSAGCGDDAASSRQTGTTAQAITSGVPDDADTSAVLVVAKVHGRTGFCSGVVVSPHVVLTAAHCATMDADYAIFLGADYDDGSQRDAAENLVAVAAHHPHPDHDTTTNEADIGVLVTAAPIPRAPARINRRPLGKADVGRPIRIVGFGQTSGGSTTTGRRTQGSTTIAELDPTSLGVESTPNICLVDSGGPTYMEQGGEDVVVGVHFIIDSATCDGEGFDVRVDAYTDFIDAQIAEADPPGAEATEDAGTEAVADADGERAPTTPPGEQASGCSVGRGVPRGAGATGASWLGSCVALAWVLAGRRRRARALQPP
jgi:hypothetical protein